jgi:hypothetical protein
VEIKSYGMHRDLDQKINWLSKLEVYFICYRYIDTCCITERGDESVIEN